MKPKSLTITLVILPLILLSCIGEDNSDCPTPQLTIAVKDKNYFNIHEIEGLNAVDENQALMFYANPLLIWMGDENSGSNHAIKLPLGANERYHNMNIEHLTRGNHEITAIGNTTTYDSDDPQPGILPLEGDANTDLYMVSKEIHTPLTKNDTIYLQRTKGKLITRFTNLPDNIASIYVLAEGVYASIRKNLTYDGASSVAKLYDIPEDAETRSLPSRAVSHLDLGLLLAPSVSAGNTRITLKITYTDSTFITLSNILVNMERNKITLINPNYDPITGEWVLSVFIDGVWRKVHNLIIEE